MYDLHLQMSTANLNSYCKVVTMMLHYRSSSQPYSRRKVILLLFSVGFFSAEHFSAINWRVIWMINCLLHATTLYARRQHNQIIAKCQENIVHHIILGERSTCNKNERISAPKRNRGCSMLYWPTVTTRI